MPIRKENTIRDTQNKILVEWLLKAMVLKVATILVSYTISKGRRAKVSLGWSISIRNEPFFT